MTPDAECVWIIDDTESQRRLYGELLRGFGYRVRTIPAGLAAVDLAGDEAPDLVLLDVQMPQLDGFETCRRLRATWNPALVPILMLTAVDDRTDYVRGLEAGADDYLIHPIELDVLRARVAALLRQRRLYLELCGARTELSERVDQLHSKVAERERQLLMADRLAAIGQMAAAIAHEINNPLAYVSANANYCLQSMPEDVLDALRRAPNLDVDDWLDALGAINEGVEKIRAVVRDVATFSRGNGDDAGESSDVARVIESATHMARHAAQHCATIESDLGTEPLHAALPASRLAQVVLNLLINAAHACEERGGPRGTIRVRAWRDDRVHIEVHDNGQGIDEARLGAIFEPFHSSKAPERGTGLGLSICRDIVARAGGSIEVSSQLGEGTTFSVTLPRAI